MESLMAKKTSLQPLGTSPVGSPQTRERLSGSGAPFR